MTVPNNNNAQQNLALKGLKAQFLFCFWESLKSTLCQVSYLVVLESSWFKQQQKNNENSSFIPYTIVNRVPIWKNKMYSSEGNLRYKVHFL